VQVSSLAVCINNGQLCSDAGYCATNGCVCNTGRMGAYCQDFILVDTSNDALIIGLSTCFPVNTPDLGRSRCC
jgi:hypothetical protein